MQARERSAGNELPSTYTKRSCSGSRQKERIALYVFSCCLKVKWAEFKHTWVAAGKLFVVDVVMHTTYNLIGNPFCRTPAPKSAEQYPEQLNNRIKANDNDPTAFFLKSMHKEVNLMYWITSEEEVFHTNC
jgi:hypothetical protein